MSQLNFDATRVQPSTGIPDPIPAGWYNAIIDESEMKPTRSNDGAYLSLRFNVIDGQFAGRKVFARLNLRNANPVAQEIAYKDLSAIAHAVGVLHVQDSQQLHGIPLKIKVSVRKGDGNYDDSNEVKAYRNVNDPGSSAPQAVMPAAAPSQPAAPQGWNAAPPAQPAFVPPQPAFVPPAQPQQAWNAPPAAAPMAPPAAPMAPPAAPAAQPMAAPGGATPPWVK